MNKTFPSRIGWEILLPICLLFGWFTRLAFQDAELNIPGIVVMFLSFVFIAHLFLTTWYSIKEDGKLKMKMGVFPSFSIDIQSITRIEKTNSILSSPAPTLFGRIKIHYDDNSYLIISPKDKIGFIKALCMINDKIEVSI